jgi:hypothetical protein
VNANDLADKLEQGHWKGGIREQAATMLRQFGLAESIIKQQQTEIETLKSDMRMLLKEYYEYCVKKK